MYIICILYMYHLSLIYMKLSVFADKEKADAHNIRAAGECTGAAELIRLQNDMLVHVCCQLAVVGCLAKSLSVKVPWKVRIASAHPLQTFGRLNTSTCRDL